MYNNRDMANKILSFCIFMCEDECHSMCCDMRCMAINMFLKGEC